MCVWGGGGGGGGEGGRGDLETATFLFKVFSRVQLELSYKILREY